MEEHKTPECTRAKMIEADKAIMHLNYTNRRLLIAFIAMCVAFVTMTIGLTMIFTNANTQRERQILELLAGKNAPVTEVTDGVQQQADY